MAFAGAYTARPMGVETLPIFLLLILLGSYVQSVTGFGMGMIITATAGGSMLLPLPLLAAVVSLLSLLNVCLALRGELAQIHKPLFAWLALGQVPAIGAGLWLLLTLDSLAQQWLYLALGVFVTLGSLSMALRPTTRAQVSGPVGTFAAGLAGGLVGGLFSASGPVMGWFIYRQPLALRVVRATLLSCFFVTTSTRTLMVGSNGGLTQEVLTLAAWALPVVVLGTWLGRVWPPPLAEASMKRGVFVLVLVMGIWILANAWVALLLGDAPSR